jgi:hypothetical protein
LELNEIKPGDVLFVWGVGTLERIIESVTHGPSHCALFINENTVAEAQGGRTTGTESIASYLDSTKHLEVWRDESLTDAERASMVEYARAHFGIHYDYLSILAELAHFELGVKLDDYHEGNRRICSTYVTDIAKSVGRQWARVSVPAPVDVLNGGELKRKGVLKNAE